MGTKMGKLFNQLEIDRELIEAKRKDFRENVRWKTGWIFVLLFLLILISGYCTTRIAEAKENNQTQGIAVKAGSQALVNEHEVIAEEDSITLSDVSLLWESLCPLPEAIESWGDKTQAKWQTVRRWCPEIFDIASRKGIDPFLWASLTLQESGGWAGAESSAGAMGLSQVMPFHDCADWDPVLNMECGTNILSGHLSKFSLRDALAAYNAGENGMKSGNGYIFADAVLGIYGKVQEATR